MGVKDDGYANVYVCRDRKIDVPYVDALTGVSAAQVLLLPWRALVGHSPSQCFFVSPDKSTESESPSPRIAKLKFQRLRSNAPPGGKGSDSVNALIVALDLMIKRTKAAFGILGGGGGVGVEVLREFACTCGRLPSPWPAATAHYMYSCLTTSDTPKRAWRNRQK